MSTKRPVRLALRPRIGAFAPDAVSTVVVDRARTVGGTSATGSLLYWSDTRFGSAFALPLHRHEGLETITIVLDGRSQHYDTGTGRWADLAAGDLQVMRAGTGLQHAERVVDAARVLQLMVDPGPALAAATPTYADHRLEAMPTRSPEQGVDVVHVLGGEAPAWSAGGLVIRRIRLSAHARVELDATPDRACVALVLGGAMTLGPSGSRDSGTDAPRATSTVLRDGDALDVSGAAGTRLVARETSELLVLTVPSAPTPFISREASS
ncbi:pirin family protein [Nocardioides sp.]|uniref:pirin family protein n=1 Tax=Nocardioides sp. TaxID=35761 RepID=UPI0035189EB2